MLIPAGGRGPLAVQAVVIADEEPPGTTMTYTLDGSDPTATSAPWPGTVQVTSAQVLKARWFHHGVAGPITSVAPLP